MTTHRLFRLLSDLNDIQIGKLTLEVHERKLCEADVIIWDESSMISKKAPRNRR